MIISNVILLLVTIIDKTVLSLSLSLSLIFLFAPNGPQKDA